MNNLTEKVARLVLALIFLVAGGAKLANPIAFEQALNAFQLFPTPSIPYLARFVPTVEIFSALLLLLKNKHLGGYILSAILSAGFVISLWIANTTQSIVECGCFGTLELGSVSPKLALTRAIILLILSALLTINTVLKEIKTSQDKEKT